MKLATRDPDWSTNWTQSNASKLLAAGGEPAERTYILIGPEGFHGPPANAEQGKVCLIIKREGFEDGIVYGTPLDTVIVYRIPGFSTVGPNSTTFAHWQGAEVPDQVFCIG